MNPGRYRFKVYLNARHKISFHNSTSNIHPHTWELVLYVNKTSENFIRFSDIENIITDFLSEYEGKCINELKPFDEINPTMENIGDSIASDLSEILSKNGWALFSLEISENPARTYIVQINPVNLKTALKENNSEDEEVCSTASIGEMCSAYDMAAVNKQHLGSLSADKTEEDDLHIINEAYAANEEDTLPSEEISGGRPEDVEQNDNKAEKSVNDKKRSVILKRPRKKHKRINNSSYIILGMLLLLTAGITIYLYLNREGSFPWGSDSWYHLFKGHMLYLSGREGNFFPLYSEIWYNGIQPLRYWAPLPHYVLAIFELITNGDIGLAYNLFIIFCFIAGGTGWVLWGAKTGRRTLGCIMAVLWSLLPDNLRVMFSEGNLSRVAVTVIFPYLLLMASMHFIEYGIVKTNKDASIGVLTDKHFRTKANIYRSKVVYLCGVFILMFMITLCHAMIAAMAAITITLFSVITGLVEKKLAASIEIIAAAACGIAAAGIWLVPALTGGLLSMNSEAVKELAEGLTYPVLETLDPMRRLADPNVFYFGTSIAAAALIGVIFGEKKTKAAFAVTLIIFTGTTKLLLPVILKLPLSQAFWMMRFTPMAMGTFFAGLFFWKKLNRKILAVVIALVITDSVVSFSLLAHNSDMPQKNVDILKPGAALTDNRIALIDNSRMGSFPSFFLSFNESGKIVKQVFGSGWQGAATAQNIMLLNTAAEKGWYEYLFDRCLEHGADVVVITGEMLSDANKAVDAARKAGYILVNGYNDSKTGSLGSTDNKLSESVNMPKLSYGLLDESLNEYVSENVPADTALVFKYPISGSFGSIANYQGIGIGRYASNLSLVFPQIETGRSFYIDDYSFDELTEYKTVFLSGFSFRSRQAAEKLLMDISESGTRVVVDLTNADAELLSSRAGLFGVLAENIVFEGKLPDMEAPLRKISFSRSIPDEYEKWSTIYLENLDNVHVSTYYENHFMDIIGTKVNDNLFFVGVNLPYYAMLTGDHSAIELLEDVTGLDAGDLPGRRTVKLKNETRSNMIALSTEEEGVITGVAALDSFHVVEGGYSVTHNLVKMDSKTLILKAGYPVLGKGLTLTLIGLTAMLALVVFLKKRGGRANCSITDVYIEG